MRNIVWVPLAGTVAALAAVLICHGEQEGSVYPMTIEAPKPRPAEPGKTGKDPAPVSAVRKFRMVLREDASFSVSELLDGGAGRKEPLGFKTLDEFLDYAAPKDKPRPFVLLLPESGKVTNKTLLEAAQTIAERCEVKVDTGESKKTPHEKTK